jgi:hypothetical protein
MLGSSGLPLPRADPLPSVPQIVAPTSGQSNHFQARAIPPGGLNFPQQTQLPQYQSAAQLQVPVVQRPPGSASGLASNPPPGTGKPSQAATIDNAVRDGRITLEEGAYLKQVLYEVRVSFAIIVLINVCSYAYVDAS